MAVVPFTGVPSVAPSGSPTLRQDISASPAEFGSQIGQSEQVLGRDIGTAGNELFQSAVAQQEMYNKAAVQDATNKALDIGTNVLYDPDKGYLTTRGRTAMDGYHSTVDTIKSQFQTIRDGLHNDAQKTAFDETSRRYMYYYQREAGSHADQQSRQWYDHTDKATILNAIQTSATSYNNTPMMLDNLNRIRQSIVQTSQRNGDSPEATELNMWTTEGQFVLSQLRSQAIHDPAGALDRYNRGFLPDRPSPDPEHPGQMIVKHIPIRDLIDGVGKENFIKPLMAQAKDAEFDAWVSGQFKTGAPRARGGTPFVPQSLPQGVSLTEDALVRTVAGEAGNEPLNGQRAVAAVIMNRSSGSGMSPRDVVFAPNQFEPWNGGAARARLEAMDPSSPQYQRILNDVVRPVMAGTAPDPTGGATHFYAPKAQAELGRAAPSWATGTPTVIGNHNFYKIGYGRESAPPPDQRASANLGPTPQQVSTSGGVPPSGVLPPPDFEDERSPQEAAMPDEEAIIKKAIEAFPDPADQRKVVAKIQNRFSIMNAAVASDRRDFLNSSKDLIAAALDGKDINYNEAHIRHILPPAQAADMLEKLGIAQAAGQSFKAVQWGSPEQIDKEYQTLSAGLGPDTRGLRVSRGHVQGLDKSGAIPPEPTEDQSSSEQYRMRLAIRNAFTQKVHARAQMLDTNPVAYVSSNPIVREKAAEALATANAAKGVTDKNDPRYVAMTAAKDAYFQKVLDVQAALGVQGPYQHILTQAHATEVARRLQDASPATTDVGKMLDEMGGEYGKFWNQAYGDIKTLGKLPPDYQVLAMVPNVVDRHDFQQMLKFVHSNPKGVEQLHSLAGPDNMKDINNLVSSDGTLRQFYDSLKIGGGAANGPTAVMMENAVKNLSAWYMYGGETSTGHAVRRATTALIDNKYDFDGPLRVPKGKLGPIENYGDSIISGLDLKDINTTEVVRGLNLGTSTTPGVNERILSDVVRPVAQQQAQETLSRIRRTARWVTNESDSGAVLTAQSVDGIPYTVMGSNGRRIEFSFSDAVQAHVPWTSSTVTGGPAMMRSQSSMQ